MNKEFVLLQLQLLSSRICHDLINPVGALKFSMDMLKDNDDLENIETLNIVKSSINTLDSKLKYFRYAFGANNFSEKEVGFNSAKELVVALFKEKDVKIDWIISDEDIYNIFNNNNLKLILNVFFVIFNAVHKNASIKFLTAKIENGVGIGILVKGNSVKLGIDNIQALKLDVNPNDLTPRNIPSYFTALQAKNINAKLEVRESMKEEIQFAFVLHG
ncbi:MAG: hypothetical protein LBH40_07225 [Alphaproteobacteria bacterium]|jgi:histidine phosphotransferase ChpT|nr:hypothetical protein [Alphaproteobacteria bacterium]